jgi:hypothetical protein
VINVPEEEVTCAIDLHRLVRDVAGFCTSGYTARIFDGLGFGSSTGAGRSSRARAAPAWGRERYRHTEAHVSAVTSLHWLTPPGACSGPRKAPKKRPEVRLVRRSKVMAHGRQRSSLSVAMGSRRRCSADFQNWTGKFYSLGMPPACRRLQWSHDGPHRQEGNPKWAGGETSRKRLTYNRRGTNGVAPMCDYSLQNVKTRPAKVGDKLFTRRFSSGTGGFSAPEDINVAVCLLPGTELSFAYDVRRSRLWPLSKNILRHTAIFRQVNIDCPHAHHDALEFPPGAGGFNLSVLTVGVK